MSRVIVINATRRRELLWRHVKVRKTLDDICHTLELEIPSSERINVRKHDKIEVRCENPLFSESVRRPRITTVLVDEITASADSSRHSALVIGRSPARDIIDSTWTGAFWPSAESPMTLADITREIAAKFGILSNWFPSDQSDPTSPVGWFAWQNESPWAKLVTEAAGQGFLLTSNEAGGLYIWKPNTTPRSEGFHITEGQNVRSTEWRENGAEQFHTYIVTGWFHEAVVIDPTCNTNRVLTIDLTGFGLDEDKIRRRAETEMRRRRETRTTVTVSGWGLSDAQIKALGGIYQRELFWSTNFLIPVSMPQLGISRNLLIAEVEQEADARTMESKITLVNKEAYL
ncbi:MAG: hypothetical protein FWD91_06430 [Treponema sp.]|nr:hypothetical protein [Treponema sp.]